MFAKLLSGLRRAALTIGLIVIGGPAMAAPAGEIRPSDEIVVDGRSQKEVDHFVDQMTRVGFGHQAARWHSQICSRVFGLENAHATIIKSQIDDEARRVGLAVSASGHCETNVVVVFSLDADAEAERLLKRHARLLGNPQEGIFPVVQSSRRSIRAPSGGSR